MSYDDGKGCPAVKPDECALCGSARVDEDDDGHGGAIHRRAMGSGTCWVTIREFRVCGACVWETVFARVYPRHKVPLLQNRKGGLVAGQEEVKK